MLHKNANAKNYVNNLASLALKNADLNRIKGTQLYVYEVMLTMTTCLKF